MRRGRRYVQYGFVAKLSGAWHALTPDVGKGLHKGNSLRVSPVDRQEALNSLRYAGEKDTDIDFMAFYETPEEEELLRAALRDLGLTKTLPPSATRPILRVGRDAHCDRVIHVERRVSRDGSFEGFFYTGFMIPQ